MPYRTTHLYFCHWAQYFFRLADSLFSKLISDIRITSISATSHKISTGHSNFPYTDDKYTMQVLSILCKLNFHLFLYDDTFTQIEDTSSILTSLFLIQSAFAEPLTSLKLLQFIVDITPIPLFFARASQMYKNHCLLNI